MNLISCHGFIKNTNLTVILGCCYWLVNHYLEKGLFILEHNPNHLISVPNYLKLRVHVIDEQKIDCYTAIYSVANTLKKSQIQYNLQNVYKKNLYCDKQHKFYELFDK